jgi:hypothetical protein
MSDEDMKKQRILELKIREGVDGLLAVILKPLIPKVREEHVQALLEVLCQTIQAQPSRRSLPRAIDSLKPFASSRSSYRFVQDPSPERESDTKLGRAPFVAHYPVHNPEVNLDQLFPEGSLLTEHIGLEPLKPCRRAAGI